MIVHLVIVNKIDDLKTKGFEYQSDARKYRDKIICQKEWNSVQIVPIDVELDRIKY